MEWGETGRRRLSGSSGKCESQLLRQPARDRGTKKETEKRQRKLESARYRKLGKKGLENREKKREILR